MFAIKLGKEKDLHKISWSGYIEGYFSSEEEAVRYLNKNDYEKDSDGIYFSSSDIYDDVTLVAKIEELKKIDV